MHSNLTIALLRLSACCLLVTCLILESCTATSTVQIPSPGPKEGISRSFSVSYDELYRMAESALKELDYKVAESNRESGVIHGDVGEDPATSYQTLGKKYTRLFGARVAFRVDVVTISNEETSIQIVARKAGDVSLKDPDKVERDFIDNIRLKAAKIAERKAMVVQSSLKSGGDLSQPSEFPPSDVDLIPLLKNKVKRNAYAVIVGVENYRDLPKVDFATRDAETIKRYLIKMLGYPEEHIVLRTNERATKADFQAYFENWLKNNVDRDGEVFVYYAGHGAPEPQSGKSFLVPYDGNPSFLETTAYPLDRLYKALSELPTSHIIVVLDSCFSGAGGRSVIAKGIRPAVITVDNPIMAIKNISVLVAAQGNQISSSYQEGRHGLFTYFFLKGLMGEADANGDGQIELKEVFEYLKPQVQLHARKSNQEQTPEFYSNEDFGGKSKQVLIKLK